MSTNATIDVPLGPRATRVLEIAYAARRPVLLEGETGIGKSELVATLARELGIRAVVLDLSLLEPPDLVGLPVVQGGRTAYAAPECLPVDGAGILFLEELNRADRTMQQPALQLLTARRLHAYELPPGWVCFAAINPEDGDYAVTPLDPALRARFLQLRVRADRRSWLAWAARHDVHSAVLTLVRSHDRAFKDVAPRTWVYISDVLKAVPPNARANPEVLGDVLGGYLPPAWCEVLLDILERWAGEFNVRVLDMLGHYTTDLALRELVRGSLKQGRTDAIDEIVHRLVTTLEGPEAGVLASHGELTLASFEALIADLPGDHREQLQEALGGNPTVTSLLELKHGELTDPASAAKLMKSARAWATDPLKRHRAQLLATLQSADGRTGARRGRAEESAS
jgi:hypothetical protein